MAQKFNLSKMSENQNIVATEKQLINKNEELDTQAVNVSGNYDYRLKDVRKQPTGDAIYESLLKAVRTGGNTGITEAEMNKEQKPINGMDMRSDKMRKTPLMDYSIKNDKELEAKIRKENGKEKRDTDFWDKGVASQMLGEKTVIVSNEQHSQLISNYDTREEFEKTNKMIRTAMTDIQDADAMLYSIFRKAADERRELSPTENQIVLDINSGKIRVLSQMDLGNSGGKVEQDQMMAGDVDEDDEERQMIDEAIEKAMQDEAL